MGVDTKLLTSTTVSAEDVMEALKTMGKENVEYRPTHTPYYSQILFKSEMLGGDNLRMIHFFNSINDEIGIPMNSLSLRSDKESVEVLKTLATMFGGLFQEYDTDNNWESFQQPGQGNIRFLLDQYLSTKDVPQNCDEQIEGFIKYIRENR